MKKHLKLCVISSMFFALLVYLIWGNTALTVSNIKISSSRIPIAFSGFRIAQVSDLHNAEFGKGNRKLLELLSESKPDIIAITGDLVDAGHTDIIRKLNCFGEACHKCNGCCAGSKASFLPATVHKLLYRRIFIISISFSD